jgi:protoheme IX farnesyltransferase
VSVKVKVAEQSSFSLIGQKVRDYKMLVKLRLNLTVVFSSVMAFLIAGNGTINWTAVIILALGGFLVTGAANTLNQVLEKDYDKLMKRTADRPLAAGRMTISEAVMAAGFMSLFGITLLALFNPWTAFLGMLAMVSYAFVYTPMKRISTQAVLLGAIPGALPMLIGCVAAEGELTLLGLALFSLQFFWQFPHFWAIGWLGFDDYNKAGYKLLPTKNGERDPNVGLQSMYYALFLLPVCVIPYILGVTGIISAVALVIAGLIFAYFGWNLYQKRDRKAALQLMFASLIYNPLTLILLFIDKI